jgi:putative YpdA family bacillithiol system oxidoreductase
VLVVGANNSAVDVALETWRKGANVTMVIRETEIGTGVKYWVRPDIINRIEEGSIKAYFNSEITKITEREVFIDSPEGKISVPNDWVLAMTGYQPNLSFLEKIGIKLSDDAIRKPQYHENTMETNVPNVYLAGVICGGMDTRRLFIENSRVHAELIIKNILEKNRFN